MTDVGGGAAHVEADHALEARPPRRLHRADHAARRAGEKRIARGKGAGAGKPAVGLHERQRHAGQRFGKARRVAFHYRCEIGFGNRRCRPRHEPHQGRNLVRKRHPLEARLAGKLGDTLFLSAATPGMQERNRTARAAGFPRRGKGAAQALLVQRCDCMPVRVAAQRRCCNPRVKRRRTMNIERKDFRARLVADREHVRQAVMGHKQRLRAPALQERIGCDRRADAHFGDAIERKRRFHPHAKQLANARNHGILAARGIVRQKFRRVQPPVRRAPDHVRERAAAVYPEPPAATLVLHFRHGDIIQQPLLSDYDAHRLATVYARSQSAGSTDEKPIKSNRRVPAFAGAAVRARER